LGELTSTRLVESVTGQEQCCVLLRLMVGTSQFRNWGLVS
ncbi:uncharacterized protein METZ01_LOCUS223864, partial [marine metagenome]